MPLPEVALNLLHIGS